MNVHIGQAIGCDFHENHYHSSPRAREPRRWEEAEEAEVVTEDDAEDEAWSDEAWVDKWGDCMIRKDRSDQISQVRNKRALYAAKRKNVTKKLWGKELVEEVFFPENNPWIADLDGFGYEAFTAFVGNQEVSYDSFNNAKKGRRNSPAYKRTCN